MVSYYPDDFLNAHYSQASTSLASLAEMPSPLHITLLFKCARHTVLLSVLPSTSFSEIGSLLLLALQARNITSIADTPVPSPDQGDQVEFGIPKDKKDLKKGFVSLDLAGKVLADGKGGKRKSGGNKSAPTENPAGAGLVDGSILAFRFKSQADVVMQEEEDDDEVNGPDDPGWNVELPRYEDEEE
jgi:hypothetical protein